MARIAFVVIALAVRALFAALLSFRPLSLEFRVDSPTSDFYRLQDGAFLQDTLGRSPHSTGSFHGSPLLLALFRPLLSGDDSAALLIHAVFIAAQLVTAALLEAICGIVTGRSKPVPTGALGAASSVPVGFIYLLNPFTVLACATHSLSVLSHAVLATAVFAGTRGRPVSCGAAMAVAIHLDCHSVLLLVPALCLVDGRVPSFLCSFLVAFALLYAVGIAQTGDTWYFAHQVDFALSGPDLSPTFGLYWYLFTQIFDRFRDFFRFIFFAHTFAFVAPLCFAFRRAPVFLVAATFAVSALLRPYPTQDDLVFAAALVACSAPLFAAHLRVRALSVAAIVFAVCIAVGRVSLYMWLGAGSGNANFFYFQSLIHVACPAFALLECIAAARKHLALNAA